MAEARVGEVKQPAGRVAFIGVGLMGEQMGYLCQVFRLHEAGIKVTAWNRTRSKLANIEAKGVAIADSACEAVKAADVVLVMLSASKAIQAVMFDDIKTLEATKGKILVVMSTIRPDESEKFAKKAQTNSTVYMECPVLGSTLQASKGALEILAAADKEETVKALSPVFEPMGKPRYMGKITTSCTYKLALNQLILANTTALAFSVGYLEKSGLDTTPFMEIVQGGILNCPYYGFKYQSMLDRKFNNVTWTTNLSLKDCNLMIDDGKKKGVMTNHLEGIAKVIQEAIKTGNGNKDFAALYNAMNPSGH